MLNRLRKNILQLSLKGQKTEARQLIGQEWRTLLRLFSGGDDWEYRFLRGILWRNRLFVSMALGTNLLSVGFELFSLSFLFLAIQSLTTNPIGIDSGWQIQIVAFLQRVPILQSDAGLFTGLVIVAVIAQILRSLFQFLGDIVFAVIIGNMEDEVRSGLVEQYFSIDFPDISSHKIGDLTIYPSHVQNLGRMLASTNRFVIEGLLLIAYVGYLMWLSWQISSIGILFVLVVSFLLRYVRKQIKTASQRQLDAMVNYQELITEYLEGVRTLHLFDRKQFAHRQIRPIIDFTVFARRTAYIWVAVSKPLVEILGVIGVAFFLYFGFQQYTQVGDQIVPVLATFLAVLYRLIPRAATLNNTAGQISRQWPFVARLARFLQTEDKNYVSSGDTPFHIFKKGIEFQNVNFCYPDTDNPVLKNFSLTINKGESVALVGPSGSGKSTIVNLLMGLYQLKSGRIKIDEKELGDLNFSEWRSQVGIVDQDTFVFNDSVYANIRFGRLDATDEEIIEAAKVGNAHDFITSFPDKYGTIIGNRGLRLSGGQRQRLAIARALIRDPSILIFDEATSALDSQSERLIQASIQKLKDERTILMIAHRLSTIVWADKIVVLQNGEIAEMGSHSDLLKNDGLYAKLWDSQEENHDKQN